jgi:hypothetical protein
MGVSAYTLPATHQVNNLGTGRLLFVNIGGGREQCYEITFKIGHDCRESGHCDFYVGHCA